MTTVNINIKNCNCSGSGGGSGSDTGTDQGFDNEPSTGTTPPRGFSQSAITGRPCKVAVWCYDWVNAWLGAIGDNTWFVSTLIQVALSNFSKTLIRVLQTALGALMAGISLVDGIPGDEPYLITAGIAVALLELGTSYSADKLTEAMIGESVDKFQADRAKFMCLIAKGKNAAESKQNVQSYLASEGYPGPIQWIINSLLNNFYNIVFYTPDWWPGFDEYLTNITEVCCEGLTDGNLIEPGSAQACRGANFVLDGLVGCLTAADMYVQNYSRTSYNSLSGTEAAMLANVQANYLVPESIVNKAWSWQLSQAELARYMYAKLSGTSWLVPGSGVSTWEMGRLGAHLQTEIAICELRDCETAQAAYELLAGAIDEWIDEWLTANVTDQDLSNHIRLFCQGLIHPAGAYIGLLFAESADLAGFAGSSDCSECEAGYFILGGWGTMSKSGNSYTLQSQQDGAIHRINIVVADAPGLIIKNYVSSETFGTYFNQFQFVGGLTQWLPVHNTPLLQFGQADLDNYLDNHGCCYALRLAAEAAFHVSFDVGACDQ